MRVVLCAALLLVFEAASAGIVADFVGHHITLPPLEKVLRALQ
jgi:hypothetical protein